MNILLIDWFYLIGTIAIAISAFVYLFYQSRSFPQYNKIKLSSKSLYIYFIELVMYYAINILLASALVITTDGQSLTIGVGLVLCTVYLYLLFVQLIIGLYIVLDYKNNVVSYENKCKYVKIKFRKGT